MENRGVFESQIDIRSRLDEKLKSQAFEKLAAGIGAAGDAYGFYFFTRGFETGGHVVVEYEVGECNVSAFAGKLEGEGLADTAGGTGD